MNTITKKKSLDLLEKMVLCRRFEESCLKGYQQKLITGFCHTYIGQEAVAVGSLSHLKDVDSLITSYRCHAHGLIMGMDVNSVMAEMYGRVTGCVRGKGGSMHVFSKEHNYLGGHGIVGGQIPLGVGSAFASRYQNTDGISLIFFGDGASAQGTFHESLNLASLWDVPAIFICENNQYGMGTAVNRAIANPNIADQASGYGVEGYTIDGLDVVETYTKMGEIISKVRKESRPAVVDMKTYRFKGHSVSDAGLYRTKEEVAKYTSNDCISKFVDWAVAKKFITTDDYTKIDKDIKNKIKEAVKFAEDSPWPPLDEVYKHVFV